MSDIYIGKNLRKFESAPQFDGITKVVIIVSDDIEYSAGTDTGRTLSFVCPWGTQQLAEDILAQVNGYAYQPYSAADAIVDAAAELGDAVTVNGVYGGVYSLTRKFGGLYTADLNAPSDEEIDHEYPYKSPQDRRVTRQSREMRSSLSILINQISAEVTERKADVETLSAYLKIQAEEIEQKVSKESGSPESFALKILYDRISAIATNKEVFRIDKSGAKVIGIIEATEGGKIGGFDIMANYLSFNGQTWGGTNSTGGYFGVSGLQLGKNFRVDMQGHAKLASADIEGTLRAGDLIYGGDAGYFSGKGLSAGSVSGGSGGQISGSSLYPFNMSGGINSSLANGDYAYSAVKGWTTVPAFHAGSLDTNDLTIEGRQINRTTIRYTNSSGGISVAQVLVWS